MFDRLVENVATHSTVCDSALNLTSVINCGHVIKLLGNAAKNMNYIGQYGKNKIYVWIKLPDPS